MRLFYSVVTRPRPKKRTEQYIYIKEFKKNKVTELLVQCPRDDDDGMNKHVAHKISNQISLATNH